MFTGLIEELGSLLALTPESTGSRLAVQARAVLEDCSVGDSIAVNGCCLTVVELGAGAFMAHAGTETLERTTLGRWRSGRRVNLERALRATSRLGGHFVQGHVDAVGEVLAVHPEGQTTRWRFSLPRSLAPLVVEKGSIAVDGISLTVSAVGEEVFEVAVIPHTLAHTNLGNLRPGEGVNLEADILAKYVCRMVSGTRAAPSGVTEEFLREQGFC